MMSRAAHYHVDEDASVAAVVVSRPLTTRQRRARRTVDDPPTPSAAVDHRRFRTASSVSTPYQWWWWRITTAWTPSVRTPTSDGVVVRGRILVVVVVVVLVLTRGRHPSWFLTTTADHFHSHPPLSATILVPAPTDATADTTVAASSGDAAARRAANHQAKVQEDDVENIGRADSAVAMRPVVDSSSAAGDAHHHDDAAWRTAFARTRQWYVTSRTRQQTQRRTRQRQKQRQRKHPRQHSRKNDDESSLSFDWSANVTATREQLHGWLRRGVAQLEQQLRDNRPGPTIRWTWSFLLPALPEQEHDSDGHVAAMADDGELAENPEHENDEMNEDNCDDNDHEEEAGPQPAVMIHDYFKAARATEYVYTEDNENDKGVTAPLAWMTEWTAWQQANRPVTPAVDYTDPHLYQYPVFRSSPTDPRHYEERPGQGRDDTTADTHASPLTNETKTGHDPPYPLLRPFGALLDQWPQDVDVPMPMITETLQHFDFQNPQHMAAAERYRDAELPFKVYNVPEFQRVAQLWTDEYLADHFLPPRSIASKDRAEPPIERRRRLGRPGARVGASLASFLLGGSAHERAARATPTTHQAMGHAQESSDNFFAFFVPPKWTVETMGLPPVRDNDMTFATWAQHARYADAVRLSPRQPHFYWQAGAAPDERDHTDPRMWSFISQDLPSFSAKQPNFFLFHPHAQKGIQCRFGERGVVAATHYDSGRNMVAMIHGAKRYILSPPRECSKLGIFPSRESSIYRHSLLNFGHFRYLTTPSSGHSPEAPRNPHDLDNFVQRMSRKERLWLRRAATASTVETVLKAGEVLYIPSMWFHYIVSLQKSAQCNVRSGVDTVGTPAFGGMFDVETCA